ISCGKHLSALMRPLWERACPRTPAKPVPSAALDSSRVNPLPPRPHTPQALCSTCGSGLVSRGAAQRPRLPPNLSHALFRTKPKRMDTKDANAHPLDRIDEAIIDI